MTPAAVRSLVELVARVSRTATSPNLRSGDAARRRQTSSCDIYSRPSLSWAAGATFLRELTRLPILLKGVLHPDDAAAPSSSASTGSSSRTTAAARSTARSRRSTRFPRRRGGRPGACRWLLDSGVRGGADAFKALALGARAVLIGRPYAYGLAIAGAGGVRAVIRNFTAELDLTMGLAGCTSVAELTPDLLVGYGPSRSCGCR